MHEKVCYACGHSFTSREHGQHCAPLHDIFDWRCKAHEPGTLELAGAWCNKCHTEDL